MVLVVIVGIVRPRFIMIFARDFCAKQFYAPANLYRVATALHLPRFIQYAALVYMFRNGFVGIVFLFHNCAFLVLFLANKTSTYARLRQRF